MHGEGVHLGGGGVGEVEVEGEGGGLHGGGDGEGGLEDDLVRLAGTGLWYHSCPGLCVNCLPSDSTNAVGWWFCLKTGTNCW